MDSVHVLVALLPIQFLAYSLGKVGENGTNIWASASPLGHSNEVPGFSLTVRAI